MKKFVFLIFCFLISLNLFAQIQKAPLVGGAVMYPMRNIYENASASKDHTTLITAIKTAGLAGILQSLGPFTVFAPTNEAFDKLPAGTVETLIKLESKQTLSSILMYHVLTGKFNAFDILAKIKEGNGKATLTTLQGGTLMASINGDKIVLTDSKGGNSTITIADVNQSNGVIHVIDSILIPN